MHVSNISSLQFQLKQNKKQTIKLNIPLQEKKKKKVKRTKKTNLMHQKNS